MDAIKKKLVALREETDRAVAKAKKRKMSWTREMELKEARVLISQMKKNIDLKKIKTTSKNKQPEMAVT